MRRALMKVKAQAALLCRRRAAVTVGPIGSQFDEHSEGIPGIGCTSSLEKSTTHCPRGAAQSPSLEQNSWHEDAFCVTARQLYP
jgi:hypothetical protein